MPLPGGLGAVTRLKGLFAAASLVAQSLFLAGIPFLVSDLLGIANVIAPDRYGDQEPVRRLIAETFASYQPLTGIGILGAIASWFIYYKDLCSASWYLSGTRLLGWLWLPFIPIGTLIGIVLPGARRAKTEALSASESPSS